MLEFLYIYCEHSISKTYLRKRQSIAKVEIIVVDINNLRIANKIVTTTKAK